MAHGQRRLGSLGAGVAALSLLIGASSKPTIANLPAPASRAFGAAAERPVNTPPGLRPRIRGHYIAPPTSCKSDYGTSGGFFLGVTSGSNIAGSEYAADLGGFDNKVCDGASAIGAGEVNVIANNGTAIASFIGAGASNAIIGSGAFVGAGAANEAADEYAFVGAGAYGTALAPGSFVGAGGYEYSLQNKPVAGGGNVAFGPDSFIGAGDLNLISKDGTGSFIGGGGSADLSVGARNVISAADAFIGAGDNNTVGVGGQQSFLGGGIRGTITGSYSGIVAGYGDAVSGTGAFAGAGQFNSVSSENAFVGSGFGNTASGVGSFVGAGGTSSLFSGNQASGQDSFVGAGDSNVTKVAGSFIGGGASNSVAGQGTYAAIAGGSLNSITGEYGAITGGNHNSATATGAAVGGGSSSAATGTYATIPGGYLNAANGTGSFAAGTQAKARHNGAFVWSDNAGTAPVQSTAAYQFMARASGGFYLMTNAAGTSGVKLNPGSGAWSSLSDRTMKTNIAPLDDAAVLDKVAALPVSEWSYTSERGVRHVGPMAQDFYAAFKVGEDNRHITSIDEDGIALAAIKALHSENIAVHAENRDLRGRLARDDARLAHDDARLARDDARLAAVERKVEALAAR